MGENNSRENETILDIESGEASNGTHASTGNNRWGKKLSRLVSGMLGFNGSVNENADGVQQDSVVLLVDNKPSGQQSYGAAPPVENDKERRKAGKVKNAPKPPRPPKGPSLDAADMRLVKELSKIAMKKRERVERLKALKKMKAAKSSAPSPSLSLPASGRTISALIITVLFFLVLIFQGFGSNTTTNLRLMGAPQPAPETTAAVPAPETATGLMPIQLYETVLSDDGAAPSFVPPKSTE